MRLNMFNMYMGRVWEVVVVVVLVVGWVRDFSGGTGRSRYFVCMFECYD